MDISEAIKTRHSVRSFTLQKIEQDITSALNQEIADCNKQSGLNIQLVTDEPEAFNSFLAHYGKFKNVRNYIALIGKKGEGLDETAGYYGERIVLKAQQLGLNTCWVALTFSKRKSKCTIEKGEKLVCVIALGYGDNPGVQHKNKPMEKLCSFTGEMPQWFQNGMEAALLAPTAVNQQKFLIELDKSQVNAKSLGGSYSKVDLGIVKYHFEAGAGRENFEWK